MKSKTAKRNEKKKKINETQNGLNMNKKYEC